MRNLEQLKISETESRVVVVSRDCHSREKMGAYLMGTHFSFAG
jgi:hypothetical protein